MVLGDSLKEFVSYGRRQYMVLGRLVPGMGTSDVLLEKLDVVRPHDEMVLDAWNVLVQTIHYSEEKLGRDLLSELNEFVKIHTIGVVLKHCVSYQIYLLLVDLSLHQHMFLSCVRF